jgi:tetratricopeptide (TPR) repeat protein
MVTSVCVGLFGHLFDCWEEFSVRALVLFANLMLAVVLTISSAQAQSSQICNDEDANVRLASCTRLIERGRGTDKYLAVAYFYRGTANLELGNTQAAIADLTDALKRVPAFPDAFYERARAFSDLGKYEKAIEDFSASIELDPEQPIALNRRGNSFFALKRYDDAIKDYSLAIAVKPNSAFYFNRALANRRLGRKGLAITDYGKAIELKPDYAKAFNNRGEIFLSQLDLPRAEADFEKATAIDPQLQKAAKNLRNIREELRLAKQKVDRQLAAERAAREADRADQERARVAREQKSAEEARRQAALEAKPDAGEPGVSKPAASKPAAQETAQRRAPVLVLTSVGPKFQMAAAFGRTAVLSYPDAKLAIMTPDSDKPRQVSLAGSYNRVVGLAVLRNGKILVRAEAGPRSDPTNFGLVLIGPDGVEDLPAALRGSFRGYIEPTGDGRVHVSISNSNQLGGDELFFDGTEVSDAFTLSPKQPPMGRSGIIFYQEYINRKSVYVVRVPRDGEIALIGKFTTPGEYPVVLGPGLTVLQVKKGNEFRYDITDGTRRRTIFRRETDDASILARNWQVRNLHGNSIGWLFLQCDGKVTECKYLSQARISSLEKTINISPLKLQTISNLIVHNNKAVFEIDGKLQIFDGTLRRLDAKVDRILSFNGSTMIYVIDNRVGFISGL